MKILTFYDPDEYRETTRIDTSAVDGPNCLQCGLYKNCKNPNLDYTGEGKRKLLIIAEANGPTEDELGKQLVGKVGKFFRKQINKFGFDLDGDAWKINAVNCFPNNEGKMRKPTTNEIACCRPMVKKAIAELNPEFIWLMGGVSLDSIYSEHFKNRTITRFKKLCIPDKELGAYVIPLFHPSFIQRDEKNKNLKSEYHRDLKFAIQCLDKKPFKHENPNDHITILYDINEIIGILERVLDEIPENFYFDYETSGIKPYRPGHFIASIALCFNEDYQTYAFPFMYRDFFNSSEISEISKLLVAILKHSKIKKQAHSTQFEDIWSKEIIGTWVNNWDQCTMITTHILDNRRGFTGLKFQTYINFGVLPYDKLIKPYLKAKDSLSFNRINDAPLDQLLKYGGFDVYWGSRLRDKQKDELSKRRKLKQPLKLFMDGQVEFSRFQYNGIHIDEDYYYTEGEKLKNTIIPRIENRLQNCEETTKFKRHIKSNRSINLKSNKDLATLFYDVLKIGSADGSTGKRSVDKEFLEGLNIPFAKDLTKLRKYEKIVGTYFHQFLREIFMGKMNVLFNLNIPITYRGSATNPSFHNIPKRDEIAKRYCRRGIKASEGGLLGESDFSGIEVCAGVCYHKDPQMIKYIRDLKTDMHRDSAQDIWILPKEEITDKIRFFAKNDWVFAQFYGSWYKECAKSLWVDCVSEKTQSGETIKEHVWSKGIRCFGDFEDHCQDVERTFWDVKFKVYKKWKDEIQEFYQKNGYIDTFFGFEFTGYITRNEATNYPIQSTAFHILLWTLIELAKEMKERKFKTKKIGHIHDSLLSNIVKEEMQDYFMLVDEIGTKKIREVFPWIIVPLKIDHGISDIGKSWYDKRKLKFENGKYIIQ